MVKRFILILVVVSLIMLTIAGISLGGTERDFVENSEFIKTKVKSINLDTVRSLKKEAICVGINGKFIFFSNSEEFIRYNINSKIVEYVDEKSDFLARKVYIKNDSLYVVYLLEDKEIYFDIIKYDFNGESAVIYSDKSTSMPFLDFNDNNIFLAYSRHECSINTFEKFRSKFNVFSIKNMKFINGLSFSYMQNIDGKIIGEKIIYSGVAGKSSDDSAIIETLTPNNEIIEKSKGNYLYFLKTVGDKIQQKIIKTDEIYIHVNIAKDLLLASLYDYEKPIENSGMLKRIGKDGLEEVHIIKGIESGKDIFESKVYEGDILVFDNGNFVYFYDLKNWKYHKIEKETENMKIYYGDTVVYMYFIEGNNLIINEVRWD
ncbi:MAG: hypothetical protein U9N10_03545 [Bacillota bacterium]|nr:hypothetical protein [Bacillota bacterium]